MRTITLATMYLGMASEDAEKTAFWRPKGTGVSLARTTILNAWGPEMTVWRDRMNSVFVRQDWMCRARTY